MPKQEAIHERMTKYSLHIFTTYIHVKIRLSQRIQILHDM